MNGASGVIDILGAGAGFCALLALVYYMCRTAFNWKRIGELAAFLFLSGFIFYWLKASALEAGDTYSIVCTPYGETIKDCNGWLFTTQGAYDIAQKIKAFISESNFAKGQALIASAFLIMLVLMEYSKALVQGGIKPLVGVIATMIVTFLILNNLSEIQTQLNYYSDFLLSFGRYDHAESYRKLEQTYVILREMKVKFDAFDALQIESENAGRALGSVLTFILEILFGCLSYANVILYAVQTILLAFIPSTLAMGIFTGSYQITKPLRLIGYGAAGRGFIVAQMGAINQLNISDNFGEISSNTVGVWVDALLSIAVVMGCLVITMVAMVIYISKLIFSEIMRSKGEEFA